MREQADILQLDVVRLYDDLDGGDQFVSNHDSGSSTSGSNSNNVDGGRSYKDVDNCFTQDAVIIDSKVDESHMSWHELNSLTLPTFR